MSAVGDGIGQRLKNLRLIENEVRARCRRACVRVGPTVAGRDEPHFGQPEIQHGAGRLADILAQLRADEDYDGGRGGGVHRTILLKGIFFRSP